MILWLVEGFVGMIVMEAADGLALRQLAQQVDVRASSYLTVIKWSQVGCGRQLAMRS
jgi:hypothetical protein